MGAIEDIAAERSRQVEVEGFDARHDDTLAGNGQMAKAAACYALGNPWGFPWAVHWWKPRSYRENLVRAGALIVAEIQRIDRVGGDVK